PEEATPSQLFKGAFRRSNRWRYMVALLVCLEEGSGANVVGISSRGLALGVTLVVLAFAGVATGRADAARAGSAQVLFDDFSYKRLNAVFTLGRQGWRIRPARGWRGIPGAGWSQAGIAFVPDPAGHGNRLLRLTSTTDGTATGTTQAQI